MTAYHDNIAILEKLVAEHAFIIPIARHRYPDGTVNTEQFKTNWEEKMERFHKIPLWEKTPGFILLQIKAHTGLPLIRRKFREKSGAPSWWRMAADFP